MRSKALLLAIALASAACGNYSNEDLEFMNALPEGDALRAESPGGQSAVLAADAAELAALAHGLARTVNAIVGGVTGIVDLIRSFPPTSRTPNSRTWGPINDDEHAGFQWKLYMWREPGDLTQLNYQFTYHRIGAADTEWLPYLNGSFQAQQTARRGVGHFDIDTAPARAAGITFDWLVDTMDVDYVVAAEGGQVVMALTMLPDPKDPKALIDGVFEYRSSIDGRRQMTLDGHSNAVELTAAIERSQLSSRWLDGGDGRATLGIVEGDLAGYTREQCWDRSLDQTYNLAPLEPAKSFGDISACPDIPEIPQL